MMDQHCRFAILLFLFGIIGVHSKTSHQVASSSVQSQCPGSPAVDRTMVRDPNRGISGSLEKLSQEEDSTETLKAGESSNSKIDPNRSLPDGPQKQTRRNYPHEDLMGLKQEIDAAVRRDRQIERDRAFRAMVAATRAPRVQQNTPQRRDRSPQRQGRK